MVYTKCAKAVLEELEAALLGVDDRQIQGLVAVVMESGRIFCDGMGRSGLQVASFAMRLAQMGLTSYVVSETTTPSITANDLLLVCSGSGETPGLVEHARKAKAVGATVVVVTTNNVCSLVELANHMVLVDAQAKGLHRSSIQPMGTLFEQSLGVLLDIAVLFLMEQMQIGSNEMFKNHKNLE